MRSLNMFPQIRMSASGVTTVSTRQCKIVYDNETIKTNYYFNMAMEECVRGVLICHACMLYPWCSSLCNPYAPGFGISFTLRSQLLCTGKSDKKHKQYNFEHAYWVSNISRHAWQQRSSSSRKWCTYIHSSSKLWHIQIHMLKFMQPCIKDI